jgi:hypothetical protein
MPPPFLELRSGGSLIFPFFFCLPLYISRPPSLGFLPIHRTLFLTLYFHPYTKLIPPNYLL